MTVEETAVKTKKRRRERNPMLVKELRGRMRGARAFVVLTVYLLLLSCITMLIYFSYVSSSSAYGYGYGVELSYLGRVVFSTVALIELALVTFITPAFTAGAISGERDRGTYELLRTTLLSARRLVWGKLGAAAAYVVLLIVAAVPLESLAFMLGGVTATELILALVILLATTFLFSVLGLFFSTVARSSRSAIVLTYVTALVVTIVLPILLLIFASIWLDYSLRDASVVWQAILYYLVLFLASLSPISAAILSETFLLEQDALFIWHIDLYGPSYSSMGRIPVLSPWVVYALVSLIVGAILLRAVVRRVQRQAEK